VLGVDVGTAAAVVVPDDHGATQAVRHDVGPQLFASRRADGHAARIPQRLARRAQALRVDVAGVAAGLLPDHDHPASAVAGGLEVVLEVGARPDRQVHVRIAGPGGPRDVGNQTDHEQQEQSPDRGEAT
jgi:hypothetical protein